MSVNLGRLGWLGIAIESSSGVAVNPTDYTQYVSNTLQGKHEPIGDMSVRGIRNKNYSSVQGKKWSEGDVTINLDPTLAGYFFKMAVGTENSVQNGATGVYDHTFTVNQATSPTTASLFFDKVAYRELFPYSTLTSLEIDVKDGLATLKSSLMGQFPVTSVSGTLTTTSGIIFSLKDLSVQFGATLAAAQIATPIKVANFNFKINTNAKPIFRSGNQQPDSYAYGSFEASGTYMLYLEDQTEVNNYYNLTKQYMIFTFNGRGIGGGYSEQIRFSLYQSRVDNQQIETNIDDLFAVKSDIVAEYSLSDTKTLDIVCRNRKSSTY